MVTFEIRDLKPDDRHVVRKARRLQGRGVRRRSEDVGVSRGGSGGWSIARRSTDVATPRRVAAIAAPAATVVSSPPQPPSTTTTTPPPFSSLPPPYIVKLRTRPPSLQSGTTRKLTNPPQTTLISCSLYLSLSLSLFASVSPHYTNPRRH